MILAIALASAISVAVADDDAVASDVGAAGAARIAAPNLDPRSIMLVREGCKSSLGRSEITLFANGTIRLREGPTGAERMVLREVDPAQMDAYRNRLREIDLSEVEREATAPSGDWTESCELDLELPGETRDVFYYQRYSSGSLALERVRNVLSDLREEVEKSVASAEIPPSYKPQPGDRLERADGAIFEVVGYTDDGKGVELSGIDLPLTLFVEKDKLAVVFVRLVDPAQTP
jgi:hypothetical protein